MSQLNYLAEMTWPEVAKLAKHTAVALIPTGATEAHGPHLPMETDVIIAQGSCTRAAELLAKKNIPCLITPPFYFGVTNFGMTFAGTITIPAETLTSLVQAVCRSLSQHGFNRIVFSNHHLEPAHFQALKEGAALVTEQGIAHTAVPDVREPRWANTLTEEFRAGARHAGAYETSIVMAVRPDLVRENHQAKLDPVWIDLPDQIHNHGATSFKDAGSEQAYFGDPAKASKEEGEMLLNALGAMVATTVEELLKD